MNATPDATLLEAARGGDPAAVEALLVRYAPSVARFARRLCDDPADADDVVQETLVAAARRARDLRSAAALSTWFYTVARSFCAKKRRRSRHAPQVVVPLDEAVVASGAAAPDEAAAGRELGVALDQAIRALDPSHREVLVLRDVEGLTAPEVAAILGIDVGAVKSRLHRARVAVRDRLAPVLSDAPGAACPDVAERFSRFLEDDIGAAECAALQAHVESCASCHAACASLQRTVRACRAAGAVVPEDVTERVRAALRAVVGTGPAKE